MFDIIIWLITFLKKLSFNICVWFFYCTCIFYIETHNQCVIIQEKESIEVPFGNWYICFCIISLLCELIDFFYSLWLIYQVLIKCTCIFKILHIILSKRNLCLFFSYRYFIFSKEWWQDILSNIWTRLRFFMQKYYHLYNSDEDIKYI